MAEGGWRRLAGCACLRAKSLELCLTFCQPVDYSPPGSSVHESLQASILEWVALLFSRDLPNSEIRSEGLLGL